jgi:3-oxoacyl-[acyl-carrier-protein] synthase II
METARVVITGLGAVSPMGIGVGPLWEGLLAGRDALGELEGIDPAAYRTTRGGQVRGFDPAPWFPADRPELARSMGRASQYAVAAARMALEHARLDLGTIAPRDAGVSVGTTVGECKVLEAIDDAWVREGPDAVPAWLARQYPSGAVPMNVARVLGLRGPNVMVPTACAAGNYAIGFALDAVREGRCKVMLAGGADPFSLTAFAGFNRLLACAPERVQPFDRNRKGMMVSEGAGILVLEDLAHAAARGAPILAEVLAVGISCDAHHMTQPHPEGDGAAAATRRALAAAGIAPERVDYFSAHGTGTPANDRIETLAIKKVFGAHAHRLPVSSIKSMLGHSMGAASALEAIATVLALRDGVVPPTIHLEEPDPECDLDYVPNRAREHPVRIAVSNAYGFGGNNASLVLARWAA